MIYLLSLLLAALPPVTVKLYPSGFHMTPVKKPYAVVYLEKHPDNIAVEMMMHRDGDPYDGGLHPLNGDSAIATYEFHTITEGGSYQVRVVLIRRDRNGKETEIHERSQILRVVGDTDGDGR